MLKLQTPNNLSHFQWNSNQQDNVGVYDNTNHKRENNTMNTKQ